MKGMTHETIGIYAFTAEGNGTFRVDKQFVQWYYLDSKRFRKGRLPGEEQAFSLYVSKKGIDRASVDIEESTYKC